MQNCFANTAVNDDVIAGRPSKFVLGYLPSPAAKTGSIPWPKKTHSDADEFESTRAARHTIAGIPANIPVTGVRICVSGRRRECHRDTCGKIPCFWRIGLGAAFRIKFYVLSFVRLNSLQARGYFCSMPSGKTSSWKTIRNCPLRLSRRAARTCTTLLNPSYPPDASATAKMANRGRRNCCQTRRLHRARRLHRLPAPPDDIVAAAPDITTRKVGDRVGTAWIQSTCGRCEWCQRGRKMFCPYMKGTGIEAQGGHAEYMLMNADATYLIPDKVSYEQTAPIFCAGYTVYSGLRWADPQPHERVAVLGIGGLGHLATIQDLSQALETFIQSS